MKFNFSFFIVTLFLFCKSAYSEDCQSLQNYLNIQNHSVEFMNCRINYEDQGSPIELMYRFKGINASDVEDYLIKRFNIKPIRHEAGHPFWNSYNQNISGEPYLTILVSSDEDLYVRSREDWKNINYFYIQFSKYTRPEDI